MALEIIVPLKEKILQDSSINREIELDSLFNEFQNNLRRQDKLEEDPVDQLTELYIDFLNDKNIEPKKITNYSIIFRKNLIKDKQLYSKLLDKIVPETLKDEEVYSDPNYHLVNKLKMAYGEQPPPKLRPKLRPEKKNRLIVIEKRLN